MAAVAVAPAVRILRAVCEAAAAVPETWISMALPEVRVDEATYRPVPVVRELTLTAKAEAVVKPVELSEVTESLPLVRVKSVATPTLPVKLAALEMV